MRKSNTADAWKLYRGARNRASIMSEKAKRNYFKSSFTDTKGDSRSVWKLTKSLAINDSMCQAEFIAVAPRKVISAAVETAGYFNFHFTTIANKITQTLPAINDINFDKLCPFAQARLIPGTIFSIRHITTEEVIL